ncbi:MAG: aminoglycoside phosphotransferase family protein [Bacteroidota bacterium]
MTTHDMLHHFALPPLGYTAKAFGSGHINQTFRVSAAEGGKEYLLQQINHHVFRDIEGMMRNIERVTRYLREEIRMPENQRTLELIPTKDGRSFLQAEDGTYWRMFVFLSELNAYDLVENLDQIYEGAKSFGIFLASLDAFPVDQLVDTIPDFHNVVFRLENLHSSVKEDRMGRAREVKKWLSFVESVIPDMSQIQEAGRHGLIPLRVTHNDTKFNNVLLNKEGKGICVIDLDTVMPGYVHYDFGDGVRTTISKAAEDEADLDKIEIDLGRYEAFANGYLEPTRDILSSTELELLPISGALFAYLMGIRFLTDFLSGDVYYKIHFEGQNLQRASAQLTLCRNILKRLPELKKITHH